jgi:hypothetical protein
VLSLMLKRPESIHLEIRGTKPPTLKAKII